MPKPHNGHRSWNAWNVALWIGNDYGLYQSAIECIESSRTWGSATSKFIALVGENTKTPDGARYNRTCVFEALKGLDHPLKASA